MDLHIKTGDLDEILVWMQWGWSPGQKHFILKTLTNHINSPSIAPGSLVYIHIYIYISYWNLWAELWAALTLNSLRLHWLHRFAFIFKTFYWLLLVSTRRHWFPIFGNHWHQFQILAASTH